MFALPLINQSFKTILHLEERNGTTWFWMKLKTLKTFDLNDGKLFLDSTQNEDYYSQELLCKTMSWNYGH